MLKSRKTTKKNSAKKSWTDPDDAPELNADWFKKADLYDGERLVRQRGRPTVEHPKKRITLRLDDRIISALHDIGKGYNARVEKILLNAIEKGKL
ncbi:MAG: BrnA antitoxin family protein [Pseudomonadota bacterium]